MARSRCYLLIYLCWYVGLAEEVLVQFFLETLDLSLGVDD